MGFPFFIMSGIPSRNYTKPRLIFQRSTAQGDRAGQHFGSGSVFLSRISHDAVYNLSVRNHLPRRKPLLSDLRVVRQSETRASERLQSCLV